MILLLIQTKSIFLLIIIKVSHLASYEDIQRPYQCMIWLLLRYDEAINAYDVALQFNPKEYQALFNKGQCLDSLQQYEQAIEIYDKAIQLNPRYHKAYINKGLSLNALQRFDESMLVFTKAKQLETEILQGLKK